MKVAVVLALSLGFGCGAKLSGSPDGGGGGGGGGGGTDADVPPTDTFVAPVDAPGSACPNGRQLFLNFGAVTLTKGTSDATTNHADWIGDDGSGATTGSSPGFVGSSGGSAGDILTAVQAYLASTPITVTATRPAAGPYVMVVVGGTNTQLATEFNTATADLDCNDLNKSDVAWVSQATPAVKLPGFIIGAVGFSLGLTGTTDVNDCMCGWGSTCTQPATTACTISSATVSAATTCGSASENELTTFTTEFCK